MLRGVCRCAFLGCAYAAVAVNVVSAGNVTTSVQNRVLTLTGSGTADEFNISRWLGVVRIVAGVDTTINGRTITFFFNIDSVTIDAGEGDDFVTFTGSRPPTFTAVMYHGGGGHDTINGDVTVTQSLIVETGAGDDTIELGLTSSVKFFGENAPAGPKPFVTVDAGEDDDLVKFTTTANDKFSTVLIDLGDGDDAIFGTVPDGDTSCNITGGNGSDTTAVNGPGNSLDILAQFSTIDLGDGDNEVHVHFFSDSGYHTFDSGIGQDSVVITGVGNIDADFGDGDDNVTFDLLEGTAGVTTIYLGDGDDSLVLPLTSSVDDTFDGGPGYDTALIDPLSNVDGSDFLNFEDVNGPTSRHPAKRASQRRR